MKMNEYYKDELNELEGFIEEQKEAFHIKDLEGLTWAFKKLTAINKEMKEINQVAEAERFKIDSWENKKLQPLKQSIEYFEYKIKEYHEKELMNDPKKKSISTPYGKVKSVTTKAQPVIKDESQLIEFIKVNSLPFLESKESVKWGELKKNLSVFGDNVIDENGLIVSGVDIKPMTTTFKTEVND